MRAVGVCTLWVHRLVLAIILKVRMRAERAPKVLIVSLTLSASLMIIVGIGCSVLVEVLGVPVFEELIMGGLIKRLELTPFPLLELVLCLLIAFIHVPVLCPLLLIPLLLCLILSLI